MYSNSSNAKSSEKNFQIKNVIGYTTKIKIKIAQDIPTCLHYIIHIYYTLDYTGRKWNEDRRVLHYKIGIPVEKEERGEDLQINYIRMVHTILFAKEHIGRGYFL